MELDKHAKVWNNAVKTSKKKTYKRLEHISAEVFQILQLCALLILYSNLNRYFFSSECLAHGNP